MSRIINLCLLLAVVVCFCNAQLHSSGQQCLCRSVRDRLIKGSEVKSFQIFKATTFCNKKEIFVTMENNQRYCLNPIIWSKRLSFLGMNKPPKAASRVSTLNKSRTSSTTGAF